MKSRTKEPSAKAKRPRRAAKPPKLTKLTKLTKPRRAPTLQIHVGVSARSLPLPVAAFERDVLRALALAGFRGAMSLAVVSDAEMRRVNRDFHATDSATDVLAFPLVPDAHAAGGGPGEPGGFDAEIIVSVDTARREARARGVGAAAELMLYVVHGTLHLLGHDDHDRVKAAAMHRRTLSILAKIGYPNTIEVPAIKKPGRPT